MIAYCLNTIFCSAILLFLYKILLEKEKMHGFKRGYLLFSIVVSLLAPVITITFSSAHHSPALYYFTQEPADLITKQPVITEKVSFYQLSTLLISIYLIGLAIALLRLIYTIWQIYKCGRKNEIISLDNAKLVLMENNTRPHSFLNKIFISKQSYISGRIETEVLVHELAHVKQNHSLDILFVQIVHCIFWFNPLYHFYLKAIQLNHEFLADEAAVHSSGNPLSYQYLLLQNVSDKEPFSLTSAFNYSIIKKRLVMITTNTSRQTAFFKKLVAAILFLCTAFLFTSKEVIAQKTGTVNTKTEVPSTTEGASQQMIHEYEAIIAKHNSERGFNVNLTVTKPERDRLFAIYSKMTKEQQEKQKIGFMPKSPVKVARKPTADQLQTWTDSKKYFVRINGRKIDNGILENKADAELLIFEYYEPNKGSTDYGKYEAQINLVTNDAYAKYVKYQTEEYPYILVTFAKRGKN